MDHQKVEELSKKLSFRLADKVEAKEISIEESIKLIDRFFVLLEKQDEKELENFVNSH